MTLIILFAAFGSASCNYHEIFYSQNYSPDQPIAFSHKLHAGTHQMNCLYCHFGAEKSRHAGIPPNNVCLNCHRIVKTSSPEVQKIQQAEKDGKPIEWVRIHNLPDYALFNHSRHVSSGVTCQTCHGPVETMDKVRQVSPLSMGWCIDCHRQKGIGAPNNPSDRAPTGTDCVSCHY